jgi:hypothetical protein
MSSTIPTASLSQPTFGVDLGDQMMRDNVEVPRVLVKCCEVIESQGIDSMGIYRLSGTTSKVQRLKGYLDRGTVDFFLSLVSVLILFPSSRRRSGRSLLGREPQ